MMELEEAILHCEEVASCYEETAEIKSKDVWGIYHKDAEYYTACANEHRQLAEWLKELKRYRTARELLHKEQRAHQADFNYCEGYHDALSNVVRMIEFGEDWEDWYNDD